MPPPPHGPPGLVLPDHYRVVLREDGSWWRLGRGTAYRATDLRTGATVALRVFDGGPRNSDALGALAEYAALLARPGLPLVAPLLDFFVSGPYNVAATGWISGESLAERVARDGPLRAGPAWNIARLLLDALASLHALGVAHGGLSPSKILFPASDSTSRELVLFDAGLHTAATLAADPVAGSDATRQDLERLGATLWFALTGDELGAAPGVPLPWGQLNDAGFTPATGALPVLLARTITADGAPLPATAGALRETLNVLASLASPVPSSAPMASPAPVAPTPEPRPPAAAEDELWTRPAPRLNTPNRRRRTAGPLLRSLGLLLLGGVLGFFGGIAYQKHRQPETSSLADVPSAPQEPDVPLPPSPPVSPAGAAARLGRIESLQPDVRGILKYAREFRRVATLAVNDPDAFPSDAQVARLVQRFDWTDPASPYAHRTPILVVMGYTGEPSGAPGQTLSQQCADRLAQTLAQHGTTSAIYACGLGGRSDVPELEATGSADGPVVEVWVAFTLF